MSCVFLSRVLQNAWRRTVHGAEDNQRCEDVSGKPDNEESTASEARRPGSN